MIYPPRPEKAIPIDLLPFYEGEKWWTQIKKNGTCTVIEISDDIRFWTRHKELHKAWSPLPEIIDYFKQFQDSIIIAELLHNKDSSVKNTLYIFDIVRFRGTDLVGKTFSERNEIISSFAETNNIMIAKIYKNDFINLFNSLSETIDEGLVIKNPNAKLKPCFRDGLNANWQIKIRKPTKNYSF